MSYLNNLKESSSATKFPENDIERIRSAVQTEYDAVNMYEKFARESKNEKVSKIFKDIANEEKQHIGELETLADYLDSDFVKMKKNGEEEVEDAVL